MAENKQSAGISLGVTGLSIWGGQISGEYLAALSGANKVKVYTEMQYDTVIATLLDSMMMPLMAAEFGTKPAGDTPQDKLNAEFLEQCMNDMTRYSWRQHVLDMLSMLIWGWSTSEMVFKRRDGLNGIHSSNYSDGRIGIHILDPRGQETLYRWNMDADFNVESMVQQDPNTGKYLTIPSWKLLHSTFRSRKRSPEGTSPMRTLYRAWYTRKNLEIIEAIGAERDAAGLPMIELPFGASDSDKTKAETLIRNVRQDEEAGIILPGPASLEGNDAQKWKFSLLSSPGSKQYNVRQIITDLNKIILMRFFAQFLMLGMDRIGTEALVEGSQDFFSLCLKSIQDELLETWNSQLVTMLFSLNPQMMAGATGYPQIDWTAPGSKDVQKVITSVNSLISAQLLTPEAGLEDYFRMMLDLPDRPAGIGEGPRGTNPQSPFMPGMFGNMMNYEWFQTSDGGWLARPKLNKKYAEPGEWVKGGGREPAKGGKPGDKSPRSSHEVEVDKDKADRSAQSVERYLSKPEIKAKLDELGLSDRAEESKALYGAWGIYIDEMNSSEKLIDSSVNFVSGPVEDADAFAAGQMRGDSVHLTYVATHPKNYRGMPEAKTGQGTKIMYDASKFAIENDMRGGITLIPDDMAKPFYEKIGFEPVDDVKWRLPLEKAKLFVDKCESSGKFNQSIDDILAAEEQYGVNTKLSENMSQPGPSDVHIPTSIKDKNKKFITDRSCMVAIDIPDDLASAIAVPGGIEPKEMHITLTYNGEDLTDDDVSKLKKIAGEVCSHYQSMKIEITKIGTFKENEEGKTPFVAFVKCPELMKMRKELAKRLDEAGIYYSNDYEYTPHMTIKYLDKREAVPFEEMSGEFIADDVVVSLGARWDRVGFFKYARHQKYVTRLNIKKHAAVSGLDGRPATSTIGDQTNQYQGLLTRIYDKWWKSASPKVAGGFKVNRQSAENVLDRELVALSQVMKSAGRENLQRAVLLGYKRELDSNAQLLINQRVKENDEYIDTSLIPRIREKILTRALAVEDPTVIPETVNNTFISMRTEPAAYAGAFWSSIFLGAGLAMKIEDTERKLAGKKPRRVKWVLDPNADHCKASEYGYGCVDLAGEYESWDDLPTVPAGAVTCLGNCRCSIEVQNDEGGWDKVA